MTETVNGAAVRRTWSPAELAMSDPEPGKVYEVKDIKEYVEFEGGAKVSSLRPAYHLLYRKFLEAMAGVCTEGMRYGESNWKRGNREFAIERLNHAIDHLYAWIDGDRSEPHLAKAAWGLMATFWFDERHPEWFNFDGSQ